MVDGWDRSGSRIPSLFPLSSAPSPLAIATTRSLWDAPFRDSVSLGGSFIISACFPVSCVRTCQYGSVCMDSRWCNHTKEEGLGPLLRFLCEDWWCSRAVFPFSSNRRRSISTGMTTKLAYEIKPWLVLESFRLASASHSSVRMGGPPEGLLERGRERTKRPPLDGGFLSSPRE